MLAGMFAAVLDTSPAGGACSLSDTLDATAVAGTSTSATVTVTVPSGNSGDILFDTYIDVGTITSSQTSTNGGGFAACAEATTVSFTDGDTLAFRCNGNGVGEARTFSLFDVSTGNLIGTYTHTGA